MKHLFLSMAFICLIAKSKAQETNPPIDSLTNKITYQGIENVNKTKSDLYNKALNWFAITFKSSNEVIQIKDGDKIIGRYSIDPHAHIEGYSSASITILFKDNKYKYIITDFEFDGFGSQFPAWSFDANSTNRSTGITNGERNRIRQSTYRQVGNLILDLKKYMSAEQTQASF